MGDIVRISDNIQQVKELQKDHGEWNDNMRAVSASYSLYTGFPAEPGKPGHLNFFCPGREIAWNLSQNGQTWAKHEMDPKTWIKPGMLRYAKF